MNKLSRLVIPLIALLAAAGVQGQSSCSSDGVPQPAALVERFISADCESCWSDAKTARPGQGELALDWIVPGSRGDDAPLSAAASRDSLARLKALGRNAPVQTDTSRIKAQQGTSRKLRVAQGLPVNNYMGASIELKPASGGPWKAWLLLVETIPLGTEGTQVERNLVRNVLQTSWDDVSPSKEEKKILLESRPMSIPEGANRERLRVVGWVEDARGQIVAVAQSRCRRE
jgi:hypothetical protein